MSAPSTLAIFGDSVAWGQGLLDAHKFSSIVAEGLSKAGLKPTISMNAHSGATIGIGDTHVEDPLGREVPDSYPTTVQQIQTFQDSRSDVKWVLINGGINDVNLRCILNPLYLQADLDSDTKTYCEGQMTSLLEIAGASFLNASIYVIGYYPILSYASDPLGIEALFSVHHGVRFGSLVDPGLLRNSIVDHCLRFSDYSRECLQTAVQNANSQGAEVRFSFINTGFTEENAVFAPNALLWPINISTGSDFQAVDEVAQARCAQCAKDRDNPIDRFICERASVGHPNTAGALQIAQQVLKTMGVPFKSAAVSLGQ